MNKSEYWRIRKGIKYAIMHDMAKLNSYHKKESYLRRWDSNPSEYDGFKFYYNEKWDIKIRLFKDSTYDLI